MARYKHIDTSPRFLPIDLARQLLPGTFEHALDYFVNYELDLSGFDARYRNDRTATAASPRSMANIPSPPICLKAATTSARCRSFWVTAT